MGKRYSQNQVKQSPTELLIDFLISLKKKSQEEKERKEQIPDRNGHAVSLYTHTETVREPLENNGTADRNTFVPTVVKGARDLGGQKRPRRKFCGAAPQEPAPKHPPPAAARVKDAQVIHIITSVG